MRISIENIGQIEKADITVDGITVIAGENNTGKSTIGRTLFAMLKGMNTWKEQYFQICSGKIKAVLEQESNRLEEFCLENTAAARRRSSRARELLNDFCNDENFVADVEDFQISESWEDERKRQTDSQVKEDLRGYCERYLALYQRGRAEELLQKNKEFISDWIVGVLQKLKNIELDEVELQAKQLRESFSSYFRDQYIREGSDWGKVTFTDDEKTIWLDITELEARLSAPVRINYGIYFIESPKIFDEIGLYRQFFFASAKEDMRAIMVPNTLGRAWKRVPVIKGSLGRNLLEASSVVEEIPKEAAEVLEMLQAAMQGQAEYYAKEGIKFREEGMKTSFYPQNVSTGVKAMAVLEYAVRTGALRKNDVLVLDEPEINLHPEWQIVYARTLVLLQKTYQLKILITTHSPYFLRAIECFSDLYGVMDLLNVYSVSRNSERKHIIEDVMQSEYGMSGLYEKLSAPFDQLQEEIDRKYGTDREE